MRYALFVSYRFWSVSQRLKGSHKTIFIFIITIFFLIYMVCWLKASRKLEIPTSPPTPSPKEHSRQAKQHMLLLNTVIWAESQLYTSPG